MRGIFKIGGVVVPALILNGYNLVVWNEDERDIESLIYYLKDCGMQHFEVLTVDAVNKGLKRFKKDEKLAVILNIPIKRKRYTLVIAIKKAYIKMKLRKNAIAIFDIDEGERKAINAFFVPIFDSGRIRFYKEHQNELIAIYEMLDDMVSKETMKEYVRCYLQSDIYRGEEFPTKDKYYRSGYDELYKKKDEVWLNCGSNIGDTIFQFFVNGYSAEKIYAYEGSRNTYKKLKSNISLLPHAIRTKIYPINEYITEETDLSIIKDKLTFINADIEGNEIALLKALKNRIVKDRPVLSICVYHKRDDLVAIPEFIINNFDKYMIKLRKYEACVSDITRAGELVLYAVPLERNA